MKLILLTALATLLASQSKAEIVLVQGAHFTSKSFAQFIQASPTPQVRAQLIPEVVDPKATSIHDYARVVCQNLRPQSILLGHSQGGAVINEAFGICPEKIQALIYLGATIPFPGEKPFDLFGPKDDEYYYRAIQEDSQGWLVIQDPQAFLEAFAPEASALQGAEILKLASREPLSTATSVVTFVLDRYQKIPKLVILTLNDRVITPGTQKTYAARLENVSLAQISFGHLPMVLRPKEVWELMEGFLKSL